MITQDILSEIRKLKNKVCKLIMNCISEAPIDGQIYGRQDGGWSIITGSSQSLQAAIDGGKTWTNGVSTLSVDEAFPESFVFESANIKLAATPFSGVIQTGNTLKQSKVVLQPPSTNGLLEFMFPDKSIGIYTVAVLDDLTPAINIVPIGNFTIPDGVKNRMITLKDSNPQVVTLPAIIDAIGVIYFIKNGSTGTVDINSKLGANDISDGGTLVSTINVPIGTTMRITNDGEYFNIL